MRQNGSSSQYGRSNNNLNVNNNDLFNIGKNASNDNFNINNSGHASINNYDHTNINNDNANNNINDHANINNNMNKSAVHLNRNNSNNKKKVRNLVDQNAKGDPLEENLLNCNYGNSQDTLSVRYNRNYRHIEGFSPTIHKTFYKYQFINCLIFLYILFQTRIFIILIDLVTCRTADGEDWFISA